MYNKINSRRSFNLKSAGCSVIVNRLLNKDFFEYVALVESCQS